MTNAASSHNVSRNQRTQAAINDVLRRERDKILEGTVHTDDFVPVRDLTRRQGVAVTKLEWELARAKQKIDMLRHELEETQHQMRVWYGEMRGQRPLDQKRPKYSLRHIAEWCCKLHGIDLEVMTGNRRDRRIVLCRQQFFHLAREYTGVSFPVIGTFCGKDHTTVIHGARTYQKNKEKYRREVTKKTGSDPEWWKTTKKRKIKCQ